MLLTIFSKKEAILPNKFVNFGRYEIRHMRTEIFKLKRKHYETHSSKDFEKRKPRKCFYCPALNHLSYNCPKVKKESKLERPSNSEVQTCSVITQKELHLKNITLGEKAISALMDTGSSVSLIC
ncbi:hypothetical protein NPIL_403741 [Nephila pilipes]|uniref:Peptidase A2 domain-containing protein n=1 Tax=Nephila pilipes TaxID=299642 RepID=A0A8X6R0H5_NEPPI|nr:hypothetical protein NPIL_403741 [Nephila pilipes]